MRAGVVNKRDLRGSLKENEPLFSPKIVAEMRSCLQEFVRSHEQHAEPLCYFSPNNTIVNFGLYIFSYKSFKIIWS